ncbi:putative transmembrane protein [Mycobacterium tuberculosis]|nr:putative transmembrane protein [Mycobacterium tuberculosis]
MRNLVGGVADVCCVLVFVAIGRASHEEAAGLSGYAETAWPFLAGLAAGWVALRAWRRAEALVPVGVGVWLSAVGVGMLLRAASGQGTAPAFVIVALAFLGGTLLGWRALARIVGDRPVSLTDRTG